MVRFSKEEVPSRTPFTKKSANVGLALIFSIIFYNWFYIKLRHIPFKYRQDPMQLNK